jgi:hypothetical protein
MLTTCAADKMKVDAIRDPAAADLLASRLCTPLQIEQHLTLALETGDQAREKPVGEAIVDSVLSKQIDDLEPPLTRHGYTAKVLTEMLGIKPGVMKTLFKQTLEADRARELKEQMLAAGLPVWPKESEPVVCLRDLRCNQRGHGRPMIAIRAADDCGSPRLYTAPRRTDGPFDRRLKPEFDSRRMVVPTTEL